MRFRALFNPLKPRSIQTTRRKKATSTPPLRVRLQVEPLEDRSLLSFFAPVDYPGAAPLVADFNVDGILDLAGYLGNGDGTLRFVAPTGGEAVADFNRDGLPDVAGHGSVSLGNGDGTFRSGGYFMVWQAIAVGDLNNDGKPDGVSAIFGDVEVGIYASLLISYGNGDGTFAPSQQVYLPGVYGEPWSLAIADLDSDGLLDVVLASETSGGNDYTVTVVRGAGGITNLPGYGSRFASFTNTLAVGDVNGDGRPDIVSTIETTDEVLVNLNTGNGGFAGPVAYAAGASPRSPAVADVNRDGVADLVIGNFGRWDGADYAGKGASVLLGQGNGSFAAPEHFTTSGPAGDVAAGDFNGDGYADLTVASASAASVLINDGIWTSPPSPPPAITIGDVMVTEGNSGTASAVFQVSLSAASGHAVTVNFTTASGTATGGDYQAASGTLTFSPGETSKTITVLVYGDRLPEPNGTFFVDLSGATNATIADGQGVGTIIDDEPRISISDVAKKEGKKGQTTLFVFTVTLSFAYDQPVTMSFRTVDGTAKTSGGDYVVRAGTLTFAPGETTKTITVEVKGDSKREADETFYLDLFGLSSNALFTKNRGIGTILNDD